MRPNSAVQVVARFSGEQTLIWKTYFASRSSWCWNEYGIIARWRLVMENTEKFRVEQRRVLAGMVSGLAITALALMLAAAWEPVGMPVRPLTERLQAALRTDLFVIGWLAAAIANVARLRFFSPDDIAGGKVGLGSKSIQDATAILQNTLEQCVLAISTHLAFATVSDHPTSILIMLAILFCAGRAMFWIGYRRGANGRALGFALTFYPTIAMLGMSAVIIALGTTQ